MKQKAEVNRMLRLAKSEPLKMKRAWKVKINEATWFSEYLQFTRFKFDPNSTRLPLRTHIVTFTRMSSPSNVADNTQFGVAWESISGEKGYQSLTRDEYDELKETFMRVSTKMVIGYV